MNLYKGILIHRRVIGDNYLDVVDDGPFRSLHFNSLSIQSRMQRSQPERLVLEYTQAMMLSLAFVPEPSRILLIGLGGGSQARFLLHHFPDAEIDAVEIEANVTELAHRFFALPRDPRLRVYHQDAGDFLQQLGPEPPYDLVLIDAFDRSGPVTSVFDSRFLERLRASMSVDAVCAINMWKTDPREYAELWRRVETRLRSPVYDVSLLEDPENLVMLAPSRQLEGKALLRNCKRLEKRTGMKLVRHLERLARLSLHEAESPG